MLKFLSEFLASALIISCNSQTEKKTSDSPKFNQDSVNARIKNDTSYPTSYRSDSFIKGYTPVLNDTAYLKVIEGSVEIPPFEVEVRLSPKAEEKLKTDKATIIVKAMFFGIPKDTTSREYGDYGQIGIVIQQIELSNARSGRFEGIKFSNTLFNSLAYKDIVLLINVFSGRKSSLYNLLDCAAPQQKMSKVMGRRLIIKGRLIEER